MFSTFLILAAFVGAEPTPRHYHEINRDIDALLKQESQAPTLSERTLAICRITVLYRELVTDPRLPTSETLREYKARVWHRLTKIKAEIQAEIKREQARTGTKAKPAAGTESLATATPTASPTAGASGGAPQPDWGQDLVELIEATINPKHWDVNAGPGTIVYYRPLKALVVRATGETHRDVAALLQALRK